MKPLIYGYMRASEDVADDEIRIIEQQLAHFAETEGYCLATIFYEYDSGSNAAFYELLHELRRAEAYHVVVPSLEQLHESEIMRALMVEKVELEAGAALHETAGS